MGKRVVWRGMCEAFGGPFTERAAARGEERPEGRVANPAEGSIFGKLRDAFKAR